MISCRRTLAIARVEVLRLVHDRPSLSLIFAVPAIQVVLFGGAIQLNPTHVPIAIAGDASELGLRSAIEQMGRFRIVADALPPGGAAAMLRSGKAVIAIEVPPQDDLNAVGQPVRVLIDGADPQEAGPAVAPLETNYLKAKLEAIGGPRGALPELSWLYNPSRDTAWTLMPALAGVVVMISALLLGTLALVREREQGRWESLLASPASALDLVIGKLMPYLVVAPVQAAIVLLVAHFLFGVPLLGAVVALIMAVPLFALAHLLLGFAISASAQTQVQAIQASVFFYLPSMLLSGFMFPFAAMPAWARAIGRALPLTHFVQAARDVLLKGAGPDVVVMEMLPVAAFAVVAGVLAVLVCGSRLE